MTDDMMSLTAMTSWCLMLATILPQGIFGLKMIRVSVPQYTLRGETVELSCLFDLQGEKLYSVSWYKDHDEFYRYTPTRSIKQHIYKIDGIKVDAKNSDDQRVVIRNLPLKSSGDYRCEVSAEAPHFSSVNGEAKMTIVALPQEGPEITGEQRNYQIGDEVILNCTSAKSFPPAKLRWFVNDQMVAPAYEYDVESHQHGLLTAVAGLRFTLRTSHFLGGRLQVRCVATITGGPTLTATSAPAPVPVLHSPEHHRLSATGPTRPTIHYNREAYFFVKGESSCVKPAVAVLLVALLLTISS